MEHIAWAAGCYCGAKFHTWTEADKLNEKTDDYPDFYYNKNPLPMPPMGLTPAHVARQRIAEYTLDDGRCEGMNEVPGE
jgi:hypothetical protein